MAQGILSGPEILKQVEEGKIVIDPLDPSRVNPASVDLTLGTTVKIYQFTYGGYRAPKTALEDGKGFERLQFETRAFDVKNPWPTDEFTISSKGWVLKPGIGYLMHTEERVWTDHHVPILEGKSSLGRSFIQIHSLAGYGDPGYDGQYTLQVTTQFPVRVYPGMRFCQIRFHTLVGEPLLYRGKGNYTGESSRGAVASRLYKQFG